MYTSIESATIRALEAIRLFPAKGRSTPPSATKEIVMKKRARLSGITFRLDPRKGGTVCTIRWGRRRETWWVEGLEMLRLELAIRAMLKKGTTTLVRPVQG